MTVEQPPRDPVVTSVGELAAFVERLRAQRPPDAARVMVGLCGPPGTGKSTVAGALREAVGEERTVVVPLDGYHLASNLIAGTEKADRRGAIDTFDAASFAVLVERLRAADEDVVYAPTFERDLEEPINASLAVPRSCDVVLVEGNYLLAEGDAWKRVQVCLDEVWYLDTDPDLRRQRLVDRHVEFGKAPDVARAFVENSDEVNARLIASTRHLADRVVDVRLDADAPAGARQQADDA